MAKRKVSNVQVDRKLATEFFLKYYPNHHIYKDVLEFSSDNYYSRTLEIDFYQFTLQELKDLRDYLAEHQEEGIQKKKNLQFLKTYLNICENTKNKCPKQLDHLQDYLRQYFLDSSYMFLLKKSDSRLPLLYRVTQIDYSPYNPTSQSPANVNIVLTYMKCNKNYRNSITFYTDDVYGNNMTVDKLLLEKGYVLATEEDYNEYTEMLKKYTEMYYQIGKQYTTVHPVLTQNPDNYYSSTTVRYIIDQFTPAKLVIDSPTQDIAIGYDDISFFYSGNNEDRQSKFRMIDHCIVKLFSLDLHIECFTNIYNLEEYVYDRNVYNKLILPKEHKDCLNTILEFNPEDFSDIISNKSGGVVVLASGPAGVGKTLSAETYSELIEKPLYSVQSSQLGINTTNIEKNLSLVLERASRWKAVLLIDEADVFIRARGNDIEQNAIVGVFLRVLEHFNGVLFMTTNRFLDNDGNQFVDDAILSRCVAHIRYDIPTEEAVRKIFEIQFKALEVKCGKAELDKIIDYLKNYDVSGRDIKNIVKLGKMVLKYEKKSLFTIDTLKKVIPFHSTISKKI